MAAAGGAFARMGAMVWVNVDGENLVRAVAPGPRDGPAARAEVHAQGLPNLIHELVHAVLAGRLDDDHGIDYGGIPFDLGTPAGRALLWEELSCSALSCAYLRAELTRREIASPQATQARETRVDAWFREQVEIQPVFYGMEHDPAGFVTVVGQQLAAHRVGAEAVLARASGAIALALASAGAPPGVAQPSIQESLTAIWTRTMAVQARPAGSA